MCKKENADKCQTPLPHSKDIATAEQYRAYDETADNQLTADQALNNPTLITSPASTAPSVTGSTTGGGSSLAAETSQVATGGVITTTETGLVVEESAFQPIIFNVTPLLATGINIVPFQPRTIDATAMTGIGTAFTPQTFTMAPMVTTGISIAPFQPKTINVTPMTGVGAPVKNL